MPIAKHTAEQIADTLHKLNPFFSIKIDPDNNKVSALAKTIPLGFDELLELAQIAKDNTIWAKRVGNNIGIYISKR